MAMWLLDILWLLPPIVLPAMAVFYFCISDYQDEHSGGKLGVALSSTANLGRRLVGARVAGACGRVLHYVVYERNPLMQFFYCGILGFEAVTVSTEILPTLPTRYLSSNHHLYTFLAVVACVSSFLACISSNPGVITTKNHTFYMSRYQFGLMFPSGVQCRTCGFEKVARSKHCRLCNRCVARFDHHCQWLNVCIGGNNLPIFLLFLLVHIVCTSYASYLAIFAFFHMAEEQSLFTARFMDMKGNPLEPNFFTVARYLIGRNLCLVLLLALSATIALCLFGFLGYHLYLIIQNQTTNEIFKLQDMKDRIIEENTNLQKCQQISQKSSSIRVRKLGQDKAPEFLTSYHVGQISSFYNRGIIRNFVEAFNFERIH